VEEQSEYPCVDVLAKLYDEALANIRYTVGDPCSSFFFLHGDSELSEGAVRPVPALTMSGMLLMTKEA
jgi:hypothetical protein